MVQPVPKIPILFHFRKLRVMVGRSVKQLNAVVKCHSAFLFNADKSLTISESISKYLLNITIITLFEEHAIAC